MPVIEKIPFVYQDIPPLEVPKSNLVGVYAPQMVSNGQDEAQIIKEGLTHPIGTPRISQMVKAGQKVLILADDNTRPTPAGRIIPYLLEELQRGGVSRDAVKVLIASGTHRDMTEEEKVRKFGQELLRELEVLDHHWQDEASMVSLGATPAGTEITINKEVLAADFVLGLGHIVPHLLVGYSGGGKIIQPGVCGDVTTAQTHWLAAKVADREMLGRTENEVRHEIDAVAQQAGLDVIVNAVQDDSGQLVRLVVGDVVQAHRQGTVVARRVYGVGVPAPVDIVVSEAYPSDVDLWQGSKGIASANLVVRDGGVIILVGPCPDGVAPNHPTMLRYGRLSSKDILKQAEAGAIEDLIGVAWLVTVRRCVERATGILATPGIRPEEAWQLGWHHAPTPQEALGMAFHRLGADARVVVLKHGGEILPLPLA